MIGSRASNNFLRSAGLGRTGVGDWQTVIIDYKEGEVVDENRVEDTISGMIEEMEKVNHQLEIIRYELISISPQSGQPRQDN